MKPGRWRTEHPGVKAPDIRIISKEKLTQLVASAGTQELKLRIRLPGTANNTTFLSENSLLASNFWGMPQEVMDSFSGVYGT